MAGSTQVFDQLSRSAQRAVRWAAAAAAHREGQSPGPQGTPVNPFDLLVGVLLAHPDPDGEASVLLHHFGLTARDIRIAVAKLRPADGR